MKTITRCKCGSQQFTVLEDLAYSGSTEEGGKLYVHTSQAEGGYTLVICKECNTEYGAERFHYE